MAKGNVSMNVSIHTVALMMSNITALILSISHFGHKGTNIFGEWYGKW